MHEMDKEKIRKSLNRHVFADNPLNEAKKEKLMNRLKEHRSKRMPKWWSIAALVAAAAFFIYFIGQNGSFSLPNHSKSHRPGPGSSSSASWAFSFVKYKGTTYVLTQQTVKKAGKKIGEVTHSSDRETSDESGNFSNSYPKGTKYFAIPGVPVPQAIAVQKPDGTFIKAINQKTWMSRPEAFNILLGRLGSYRELHVQSIRPSKWLGHFPEAEKVSLVKTNLGNMNVVVFPRRSGKVRVQTVSNKTGDYKYKINERSISSKQPLFFYQAGNLVAAAASENLKEIFQMETRIQKQSIFEKIDWTPSPKFTYHQNELIGEKGKLGITSLTKIYAGKPNKFVWWFMDNNLPDQPFQVVGIQKNTGAKTKVLLSYGTYRYWGFDPVQQGYPTEMVLPEPGIWSLTTFVGGKYYGSIVVNVLPNDSVNGKTTSKVVVDKVGSDLNHLQQFKTFTSQNQKALKVFANIANHAKDLKGVIDTIKPDYVIEMHYTDGTSMKFNLWLGKKGEKSMLLDQAGSKKKNDIPASTTNELRKLLGK